MKNIIKNFKLSICFLLVFVGLSNVYSSNNLNQKFEQANQKYKDGQFYDAIELYNEIIESKFVNFETYFNLANSYYKLNQIPESIYYYEKAFQISPRNKDLQHNLKLANSALTYTEQKIPDAFHVKIINAIMRFFAPDTWAFISLVFLIITLCLVFLFLFSGDLKFKKIFFVSSFVFLFFTFSSVFIGQRYVYQIKNPTHGIIMISNGAVKSSPDISGSDIYVVYAGMKVRVLSKIGDWYEIQVAEGNKGWVETSSLRLI